CAAGAAPPAGCVKVSPAAVGGGVAVMVPELTVNVTLMEAGLPAALGEVTTTDPVYVPAARFAGLAEIDSDAGVVPLFGVTESQFVPAIPLWAAAVKFNGALLPVLVTWTV